MLCQTAVLSSKLTTKWPGLSTRAATVSKVPKQDTQAQKEFSQQLSLLQQNHSCSGQPAPHTTARVVVQTSSEWSSPAARLEEESFCSEALYQPEKQCRQKERKKRRREERVAVEKERKKRREEEGIGSTDGVRL